MMLQRRILLRRRPLPPLPRTPRVRPPASGRSGRVFFALVVAGLVLLFVASYFRLRPPAGFNDKVAQAEVASQQLTFGTELKKETLHLNSQWRTGKGVRTRDCSRGSYTTPTSSGSGVWCMKGYARYFGVALPTSESLADVHRRMLRSGWTSTQDADEFTGQTDIILHDMTRGGGYLYRNASGLTATVGFARHGASWENCKADPLCVLANDQKAASYPAVMSVSVVYEVRPF